MFVESKGICSLTLFFFQIYVNSVENLDDTDKYILQIAKINN